MGGFHPHSNSLRGEKEELQRGTRGQIGEAMTTKMVCVLCVCVCVFVYVSESYLLPKENATCSKGQPPRSKLIT